MPKPHVTANEVAAPSETAHEQTPRRRPYRPWAELLMRTFGLDVLALRRQRCVLRQKCAAKHAVLVHSVPPRRLL